MNPAETRPKRHPSFSSAADVCFWIVAALAVAWGIASLSWPFGMDQGVLAWVGDVIARGGIPYRDAWDMKGPLAHFVYAFAQKALGRNVWSIRVVDLLVLLTGVVALVRIVASLTSGGVARWTGVVFVLWYGSMSFMDTAQPDGWVSVLVLLALAPLLIAQAEASRAHALVAGLLIGLCTLSKPFYAGFLILPLIHFAVHRRDSAAGVLVPAASMIAAFLAPIVAAAAWFGHHGAIGDLVDVHLLYTSQIYSGLGSLSLGTRVRGVVEFLWLGKVVVVAIPPVVLGAVVLWQEHRRVALVVLTWVALVVAFVALQNRFSPYQWLPLGPPLAILGGVGFDSLFRRTETGGLRPKGPANRAHLLGVLVLGVIVFHASFRPAFFTAQWLAFLAGQSSKDQYYSRLSQGGWVVPVDAMNAARYVQARTDQDDRVAVWGYDAGILFMAGRKSPSRLGGWSGPLVLGQGTAIHERYWREYLRDLRAAPPKYFVVNQDESLSGSPLHLRHYRGLEEFLRLHYKLESRVNKLEIYRLSRSLPADAEL